jgi:hypothetical protein
MTEPRPWGVGAPVAGEVNERAGSVGALVGQAVDVALESLDRLERQAHDVARALRSSGRGDARQQLAELMMDTQRLVKLASVSADASGLDLERLCESHGLSAEARTNAAISEIIWHQLSGDIDAIATTLDRSFAAALEAWRRVFAALSDAPPDPFGHAA